MEDDQHHHSVLNPVRMTHEGMDLAEYHARPERSAHNLMDVEVSPQYSEYRKKNPAKQTPAMLNGTVIHEAIENWEKFDQIYVRTPEVDRRTNAGKEQWKIFQEASEGKTLLTPAQWVMAENCREAAWEHPEAKLFLEHSIKELSGFGQVLRTPVKARPDLDCSELSGDLVDIKSRQLGKAGRDDWLKDFFNYKLYIQAGLQIEVWRQLGFEITGYYYLLIETEPPYQVNVLPLDQEWIDISIAKVYQAVQKWEHYLDHDKPKGYGRNQPRLEVPEWMRRKLEWP